MEKEDWENLNQAILATMERYVKRPCLQVRRGKRYQNVSYWRIQTLTFRLARFFSEQGISRGERVAIVADNSGEWLVVYLACLLVGGVAVPIRPSLPAGLLQFILKDSGARVVVIQNETQYHLLKEMSEISWKLILSLETLDTSETEVTPLITVLAESISEEMRESLSSSAATIAPTALASIHYTGYETGQPRGVTFTQAQRLATLHHMAYWFELEEDDLALTTLSWSYLPSLDATLHYFVSGVANVVKGQDDSVFECLQQTSPTVTLTIPYSFEQIYNLVFNEVEQYSKARRELFQWALAISREYYATGPTASPELRESYRHADITFFSQIRARLGGRLSCVYSCGAPLSRRLAEFAQALGLLPLELYNMSEAGGFPAANHPTAYRFGSCGQVASGFQIRIADDGEILVRGESLMEGYWQRPEQTREMVDADGWLHTGDVGRFDVDGYLYLTGRKKSMIILSTGRKIIPRMIEELLVGHLVISQAVIFGEARPYVVALIVPDLKIIATRLKEEGQFDETHSLDVSHPQVKAAVDQAVQTTNGQLAPWEQIRAYTLLEHPLTFAAGELNEAMNINRSIVGKEYAGEINAMYPVNLEMEDKVVTQVQLDPGELQELLVKQDILDAWMEDAGIGFLFDLAQAKEINPLSMIHIAETVVAIAQMQKEEKPLSTALIVGDPIRLARVLPSSEIQLHRYDRIRRMRQVMIMLAKLVDGIVLGYGVDRHGYVRGIYKLEVEFDAPERFGLFGPHFGHHATISDQCDGIVFFVPVGGRQVRVFADGQLVGRYANGNWSLEGIPNIDEAITHLADQKHYELSLLRRLFTCAFLMSEANLGAIFILGDATMILERSDPPEISAVATIVDTPIKNLSNRELINFAKQDGATIIDLKGNFRGCMVLLRPDAATMAEIGPGKGARHSSAAKMSAEVQCLAIVISQDGPITVYDSGKRILSL